MMSEKLSQYITSLVEKFEGTTAEFAGETTVILPVEKIESAARFIHDYLGFKFLSCLTAVDYYPQEEPRFHLFYRFTSISETLSLNVRVPVSGINPSVSTLEKVYHNANWHEREVYDLFGIKFEGHSDLRRLIMPADWQGHPLRKDYPLGYEEPQYTFNYEEISVRKPKGSRE